MPVLLFVLLYVGSGIYFSIIGMENAFYQLSPIIAIIPAIALGWILYKGSTHQKMRVFIDGVRHPDIITMCVIFLLAGAFSSVTTAIGSLDSTVYGAQLLLAGTIAGISPLLLMPHVYYCYIMAIVAVITILVTKRLK